MSATAAMSYIEGSTASLNHGEQYNNSNNSVDHFYHERISKLEADFSLILDKLQLDNQTIDIRFQLLQKGFTELRDHAKIVTEELNKIKTSEVPPPVQQSEEELSRLLQQRDEELIQQIRANEQTLTVVKQELNEHISTTHKYPNSDDDFEADMEVFQDDEDVDKDGKPTESARTMQYAKNLEHRFLPDDTFSYFAVAQYVRDRSLTSEFSWALFVLIIQLVTLSIFVMDVVNVKDPNNLISVPPGVGIQVRTSQFIALIISCWNQDEVRASFNVLSLGYNAEKVYAISPYANRSKWFFSIIIRIFFGCYSLAITFILIVKSETVRDVMLDFAAVTFVSELDNGAFLLSLWGYLGKNLQQLTMRIKNLPVHQTHDGKKKRKKIPRLGWLLVIMGVVLTFWVWITVKQGRGLYMDQTVSVQFSDEFSPAIGGFSGLYHIQLDNTLDGMIVNYVDFATERAIFSYCSQDSTWLFQYGPAPDGYVNSLFAECWSKAKSSVTDELDITKAALTTWYVFDEDLELNMPLQHFSVTGQKYYYGMECPRDENCGDRMYCAAENENEKDKICVCNKGLFGSNCEFPDPCQVLDIDPRNVDGFFGTRSWSRRYSSIYEEGNQRPITVYGKPVYIGDSSIEGIFDVMFFIGRRWILTDSLQIEDYSPSSDLSATDLALFLADNFHAYWSNYTFFFASEPVDVGTPIDAATPEGLRWFRLDTSGGRGVSLRSGNKIWQGKVEIEANLFCSVCNNETNPCRHGSTCRLDGSCDCTTGASGKLCQIPPDGDGLCNFYFNTPEFNFDGGDCCYETCASTEEHICGYGTLENIAGVSAYGFIGFPDCQDPRFRYKLSGSTTLFSIMRRGTVRCGSGLFPWFLEFEDGDYSGFEADLCRAIASAVFGDPESMEIVETSSVDRFTDLSKGKFDVLLRRTTYTAERDIYQGDASVGFSFVPIPTFYDGLRYGGIPPYSECVDNLDFESVECSNLKICVTQGSSWHEVTRRLFPDSVIVVVNNVQAMVDGLEVGICNVIAGEVTALSEFAVRKRGFTGPFYDLGDNVYSKEPLAAATRQDDRVWLKFVSWVFEALIQAEESGVTKATAHRLAPTDVFGEEFQGMFQNAVAAVGNYGEIYDKNLETKIPRGGLNTINRGGSGLIYSFPFGEIETRGANPVVAGSIEVIRKRGTLNCGISKRPGFAELDPETGIWKGFTVDFCRGIAAALFGGSLNVNFIPLSGSARFKGMTDGVIDVMLLVTHTLTREVKEITTGEAFDFSPTVFYDGMGFGGRPPYILCAEILDFDGFALSPQCVNTTICVSNGTSWLEAIQGPLGIPQRNIFVTSSHDETYQRFITGDCNVIAGETPYIAEATVRSKGLAVEEEYLVATRTYTKEPIAIMSRSDDPQFSDLIRWIVHGFFYAAEQGITREEYYTMPATNYLFGESLSGMWQHAVGAVGNYDEIYDRNLQEFGERKGPNKLNRRSGPQFFAMPGVTVG